MTPEAQRIAIAEALGWKKKREIEPGEWVWIHPDFGTIRGQGCIPDYTHDLNAMHEAEGILSDGLDRQCQRYIENLELVRRNQTELGTSPFGFCHATAAQRAEAFLHTIGKWVEE